MDSSRIAVKLTTWSTDDFHFLHGSYLQYISTSETIIELIQTLESRKIPGVTSIGCGPTCLLEYLLAEVLEMKCIDVLRFPSDFSNRAQEVALLSISEYQSVNLFEIGTILEDHALLFCFPITKIPWQKYLSDFKGDVIILISDHTCHPQSGDIESMGWEIFCQKRIVSQRIDAPASCQLVCFQKRH